MENSAKIRLKVESAKASAGDNALIGMDEEHPLPLDGVTKFEFERLMSLIYPP
jgi:hypothetical protein